MKIYQTINITYLMLFLTYFNIGVYLRFRCRNYHKYKRYKQQKILNVLNFIKYNKLQRQRKIKIKIFKTSKMRVLFLVSVALFALFLSVNTFPARSFLEAITENSKRQGGGKCPILEFLPCKTDNDCLAYDSDGFRCRGKILLHLFKSHSNNTSLA